MALLSIHVFAGAKVADPKTRTSASEHLLEVNKEWKNHTSASGSEIVSFNSDTERIRFHLLNVEKLLRSSRIDLSAEQRKNRMAMLDILHTYVQNGIFPVNSYHAKRQPYFIDLYGTHCAVGYLLKASGSGNIAQEISGKQNFAYVREIESAALIAWSKKYGFKLSELALIQPTYAPSASYEQVQGGTNGNVTALVPDQASPGTLRIAGDFDQLNDLPCLNVGYYSNNQLSCCGNGIAGTVAGIGGYMGQTIVAGNFPYEGTVYPLAKFDGTSWTMIEIPFRGGSYATAFYSNYNRYEVAIPHPTQQGKQEIWQYSEANGWLRKATVNGAVYAIYNQYRPVYAGAFDEVTIDEEDLEQTVYQTKNVLIGNYSTGIYETVQDNVSDTIFTVYQSGGTLYLGGSASTLPSRSDVCLSRYLNGVSQPLVTAASFDDHEYVFVKSIEMFGANELIFTGSFKNTGGMVMYYGQNIFTVNLISGYIEPMSTLNKPVHSIGKINNTFYFGGEFTSAQGNAEYKHLVKLGSMASIDETGKNAFIVSPNPSSGMISISGNAVVHSVAITDLHGKKWLETNTGTAKIDAGTLPAGAYFVHVETEKGTEVLKWVKI